MEAKTHYCDLTGTASADISDFTGKIHKNSLESIGEHFRLDQNKFKLVGLSIGGTQEFHVSLICVDNEKSTNGNEHIVKLSLDKHINENILDILFKRFEIILYGKFYDKYETLDYNEDISFSDAHSSKG